MFRAKPTIVVGGDDDGDDTVHRVQRQVDEVTNIMAENVDKVLSNMQRADDLEGKTYDLMIQSEIFADHSRELHNDMWWTVWKQRLCCGAILLFALVVVALLLYLEFAPPSSDDGERKDGV